MLHIVSTVLVLPRLELWSGSLVKNGWHLLSEAFLSFLIATAAALAFCDESFGCMTGNVMWGLNNLKPELYPCSQDSCKASSLATDKTRHPECSAAEYPEGWNITQVTAKPKSQTKATNISFIHSFILTDYGGVCPCPLYLTTLVHSSQLPLPVPVSLYLRDFSKATLPAPSNEVMRN